MSICEEADALPVPPALPPDCDCADAEEPAVPALPPCPDCVWAEEAEVPDCAADDWPAEPEQAATFPIALCPASVNHSVLSGPAAMS